MGLEDIVRKGFGDLKNNLKNQWHGYVDNPGIIAAGLGALSYASSYVFLRFLQEAKIMDVQPGFYRTTQDLAIAEAAFYYATHVFIRESSRFVNGLLPFIREKKEHYQNKNLAGKIRQFIDDAWEYVFNNAKRNAYLSVSCTMYVAFAVPYILLKPPEEGTTVGLVGADAIITAEIIKKGWPTLPLGGAMLWYATKLGSGLKPTWVKDAFAAVFYQVVGNYEKEATHELRVLQQARECGVKYIGLGQCMFQLANFEQGIEYYRKAIRLLVTDKEDIARISTFKHDLLASLTDRVSDGLSRYYNDRMLKTTQDRYARSRTINNKRKVVGINLGLFFGSIRKERYNDALRYMENLQQIEPADIETRTLVALALETSDAEIIQQRAKSEWVTVIDLFKSQPVVLEKEPNYTIYRPEQKSGLLRSALLFKESKDRTSLEDECRFTQSIGNLQFVFHSPGVRYETVKVLADVQEVEQTYYLPLMHQPGRTLMQTVMEDKTEKYHLMAAPFLAQLHALPLDVVINRNFAEPLVKRSLESDIDDNMKSILIGYVPAMTARFTSMPDRYFVFDKDSHGENYIVSEQESIDTIVAIDFQDRGLCPAPFEMSKFLEQGQYFTNDDEGDKKRDRVIDQYVTSHNQFSKKGKFNKEEFVFYKLLSDPIKALSYFCYCQAEKPSRLDIAKAYLLNAAHSIDVLERDFSDRLEFDELELYREIAGIYRVLAT